MKALVVEDEENIRELIKRFLEMHIEGVSLFGEASSVSEAINLTKNSTPDLILLDIRLGGETGFDFLENLNKPNIPVIFITAYREYVFEVFKTKQTIIDFISKPVGIDELQKAIINIKEKVAGLSEEEKTYIIIRDKGYKKINISDIVKVVADGKKSIIHLINKQSISIGKTLAYVENIIDLKTFFRINRGVLLNTKFILEFDLIKREINLADGSVETIAKLRKKEFVKFFDNLTV